MVDEGPYFLEIDIPSRVEFRARDCDRLAVPSGKRSTCQVRLSKGAVAFYLDRRGPAASAGLAECRIAHGPGSSHGWAGESAAVGFPI